VKPSIGPAIKAHLLRGAFYLSVIIAVGVIPFAVAQRVTIMRTAPIAAPTPIPTPCASGGTWTEQAPYPIAVSGHAVASVGGNVYAFGGLINETPTAAAYKYTPGTDSWTAIAPLPAARYWFTAVSDATYIYLLGGLNENGLPRAFLWRYDPATNTYGTSLSPPTIATYFHGSAYLNGKIYRIAGRGMGTDFHVEVYDIATNSWSMAANFPGANQRLMAAALGRYIYAGGGDGTGCYRYDPLSDTWTPIASLPVTRSVAASDAYNGRWVLAGGDVGFVPSTSVIAWDPVTNTWNDLPYMVHPRDLLAGATAGQSFYAVAGNAGLGIPTNDNQQYTEAPCATPPPTATATPTSTPTLTPQPTPTPSRAPCDVTGSQPACDSTVSTEVTDFVVHVSSFIFGSVQPSDFTVNGTPADDASVVVNLIHFHFNASPVVQGENAMHIPRDAFLCRNGRGVTEFMCTFAYQPSTSTPTPTPTPTPAPRYTPTPRPRRTPVPRP
jgi:hypothetical protein